MKYLLDTPTLVWFVEGNTSLSANAQKAIENTAHVKYVSIASLWEIAIKISLGKLELERPLDVFLKEIVQLDLTILPITFGHILQVSALDFFHKDPFDRIIISQGLSENLQIITKDPCFPLYKVNLFW